MRFLGRLSVLHNSGLEKYRRRSSPRLTSPLSLHCCQLSLDQLWRWDNYYYRFGSSRQAFHTDIQAITFSGQPQNTSANQPADGQWTLSASAHTSAPLPLSLCASCRTATRTSTSSTASSEDQRKTYNTTHNSTTSPYSTSTTQVCSKLSTPRPRNSDAWLLPCIQYVDREEKEYLRHMVQKMAGLDPAGLESEQRLVEILERFDIVPATELRQALMQWKVKGWEDMFKWRTQP